MNIAKLIVVLKLLLDNKEQIMELIKLIQSLFANENLIGENQEAIVYDDSASYPELSQAVMGAGIEWAAFVKLLVENLGSIKELVAAILEIAELFKSK